MESGPRVSFVASLASVGSVAGIGSATEDMAVPDSAGTTVTAAGGVVHEIAASVVTALSGIPAAVTAVSVAGIDPVIPDTAIEPAVSAVGAVDRTAARSGAVTVMAGPGINVAVVASGMNVVMAGPGGNVGTLASFGMNSPAMRSAAVAGKPEATAHVAGMRA